MGACSGSSAAAQGTGQRVQITQEQSRKGSLPTHPDSIHRLTAKFTAWQGLVPVPCVGQEKQEISPVLHYDEAFVLVFHSFNLTGRSAHGQYEIIGYSPLRNKRTATHLESDQICVLSFHSFVLQGLRCHPRHGHRCQPVHRSSSGEVQAGREKQGPCSANAASLYTDKAGGKHKGEPHSAEPESVSDS